MSGWPVRRAVGDRGSASVWVLACCGLLVVIGAVGVLRAQAVYARHRAESAADLAALAAAVQIGVGAASPARPPAGGTSAASCAAARAIAAANGAQVLVCVVSLADSGASGTVSVTVRARLHLPVVGGRVVTASARAARLPGDAGG